MEDRHGRSRQHDEEEESPAPCNGDGGGSGSACGSDGAELSPRVQPIQVVLLG